MQSALLSLLVFFLAPGIVEAHEGETSAEDASPESAMVMKSLTAEWYVEGEISGGKGVAEAETIDVKKIIYYATIAMCDAAESPPEQDGNESFLIAMLVEDDEFGTFGDENKCQKFKTSGSMMLKRNATQGIVEVMTYTGAECEEATLRGIFQFQNDEFEEFKSGKCAAFSIPELKGMPAGYLRIFKKEGNANIKDDAFHTKDMSAAAGIIATNVMTTLVFLLVL